MTPEHRALVLQTADVALGSGLFAERFYDLLFAKAPETRALFGADVAALKLKFMNMLVMTCSPVSRHA